MDIFIFPLIAALQAMVASFESTVSGVAFLPSSEYWSIISKRRSFSLIPKSSVGTALITYSFPPKGSISKPSL